jgi:magnesium-protoporphyrin O-methyltransferase
MDRCGCDDRFSIFDRRTAEGDRDRYRRSGPDRTTRQLLELVRPYAGLGATVLDVGGGIGVVDHELLRTGAGHAVLAEASPAYLEVAREEARRANLLDRLEFVDGDFVHRASEIDVADIVTLDRVVCCYPDAEGLVSRSAAHARRVLGLVLPRDGWFARIAVRVLNLGPWFRRSAYRAYVHPNALVDRLVEREGLRRVAETGTLFWRVVAYERPAG